MEDIEEEIFPYKIVDIDSEVVFPAVEEIIIPEQRIYPNLSAFHSNQIPDVDKNLQVIESQTKSLNSMSVQTKNLNTMSVQLNESLITQFEELVKKLDDDLLHYKKVKNRWTKADSSIKITCAVITGLVSVTTVVISGLGFLVTGGLTGIIITTVFGGFNALYLFLSEGISVGLTSKKKKTYREICETIALGINKLYLFKLKAMKDQVITPEEIEEAKKIIEEIKSEVKKLKSNKIK